MPKLMRMRMLKQPGGRTTSLPFPTLKNMLFNNNEKMLELIQHIRPTSKTTLKMQCLMAAGGDIDKAKKIYDFFAEDMTSLPDHDPAPQTWQASTAETVNGVLGWIKENQDVLVQGYSIIRAITGNKLPPAISTPPAPPTPLPPIN